MDIADEAVLWLEHSWKAGGRPQFKGSNGTHLLGVPSAGKERYDEQNQEQIEEDLGKISCDAYDTDKAEQTGNQSNNQKQQGPF